MVGSRDGRGTKPPTENMAGMMGQLQQILANQACNDKRVTDIERKNMDQVFVKTWERSAISETQDPIGRVIVLSEILKEEDSQGHYVSLLKGEIAAGRAPLTTYVELSKAEAAYKKKQRI